MAKQFQMRSCVILNSRDYQESFDVLDVLRCRKAFSGFVNGHFRWMGTLNLHHIDIVNAVVNGSPEQGTGIRMECAADYWNYNGPRGSLLRKDCGSYEKLAEYEGQKRIATAIYEKYSKDLKGPDSGIILLVTAAVLLAEKDEHCLDRIRAEQLKNAFRNLFQCEETTITLEKGRETILAAPGRYRFSADSSLKPSSQDPYQSYAILAQADHIQLLISDTAKNEDIPISLSEGERVYCLTIGDRICRILPNVVRNGPNFLERRPDGICLNGGKTSVIPLDAPSYAVTAGSPPEYVYVLDGGVHYEGSPGIPPQKCVDPKLKVLSVVETSADNKLLIIRNDGYIWNGDKRIFEQP